MMKKNLYSILAMVGASLLLTTPAAAAELNSGDTAWMLVASLLVLMMTIPGLALFYGGMVRKKNVLSTIMQSFAIACVMSVLWMVIGYSIAFGEGGGALQPYWGGLDKMFLMHVSKDTLNGTIPESVFIVFQMTFAIITPAIIAGAFADRMKFSSMLVFLSLWMVLVYAPICHWVWGSGGFLGGEGVLDFAGGTVVHISSGIAGLVAAIVLGRRLGYGQQSMAPHNLVLSVIGASLLWVGWFGFNAGSAVAADGGAGMAMLVTQIAAAAAGISWMIFEWVVRGKPSVLGIISGAVGGLVAITPAAGFVSPMGGLFIGLAAGVGCYVGAVGLKKMFGYDDSLDAFGIHGVGGIIGAVLTGVFAVEAIGGTKGVLEGNFAQLFIQIEGIVATVIYSGVGTFVLLMLVGAVMGLRVPEDTEIEGLDLNLHGEQVQ